MDSTLVVLLVGYVLIGVVALRIYCLRRHGVTVGWGPGALLEPGSASALLLVVVWPLTLFHPPFWHPKHCGHATHILARALARKLAAR